MVLDLKGVEYSTNEYKELIGAPKNLIKYTILQSCTTIKVSGEKSPFYLCSTTLTDLDAETDSELTTLEPGSFKYLSALKFVDLKNCKKLLSISVDAFRNDKMLENIILPPNLKYFGRHCFMDCKTLKTLDIPDSVINLAYFMIRDTTMTHISISENSNLEIIESEALKSTALTSFFVPKNVTKLDGSMFMFSYQLADITIHKDNHNFKQVGRNIFSSDGKTFLLTRNVGEITVPKEVEILAFGCFRGTKITKIHFESPSMKEFGEWFCCENNVTEFTYPRGITNVSAHAFAGSEQLTKVVLTEDIKIIDIQAFQYCSSLTTIDLLGVQEIRQAAFHKCAQLEKITLPSTVTTIGKQVFGECNKLTIDCSKNTNFQIKDNMFFKESKQVLSEYFGTEPSDILIPSHCLTIGQGAFISKKIGKVTFEGSQSMNIEGEAFRASTITEIELPSYVSSIGSNCFKDCNFLSKITFNNCGIIAIPTKCFCNCWELTSFVLPEATVTIGEEAFFNCLKLETFDISNSNIQEIGDSAFYQTALQTVVFPPTLTSIGLDAYKKSKLVNVEFVASEIYEIPDYCFFGCTELKTVIFSTHISDIKIGAFGGCSNIERITFPHNITTIYKLSFEGCTSLATLVLSKDCMLKEIQGTAFANCPNLTKIEVDPQDNNFIFENGALMSKNKTRFMFFLPASKVPVYVIPASIEDIGPYAFEGCYNLKMITIPDGIIKNIQFRAFADCKKLTFIYLPVTIREIGSEAFVGCNSLKCGSIYTSGSETVNNLLKEKGVSPILYSSYCEGQKSCNCRSTVSIRSTFLISLFLFVV